MGRPADMPGADRFPHGTRARYVCKCRCDECRAANTQYARDAASRAKARALEESIASTPAAPAVIAFGDRTRRYKNPCPGINSAPCPTSSFLRKDSTGGICAKCRIARSYRGLVSSTRAREHMLALRDADVGKKSVQAASGVGSSILDGVLDGSKPRIRAETERRILEVNELDIAPGANVSASTTWKLLDELLAMGFTKTYLASRLGIYQRPVIQFSRVSVRASTQDLVQRFHRELLASVRSEKALEHRLLELRDEFASASAKGSEWFDGEAFSFIRRAGGCR